MTEPGNQRRGRILVIGASGQLGWELVRSLEPLGEVTATDLPDLDLADAASIRTGLRDSHPDVVVNAAAYTAVDEAERQPELAHSLNARAPGVLADSCREGGAFLVHFSTDYVFDGQKGEAYSEDDRPNPLGVYGLSKLRGEQAIRDQACPHVILRTSWLYSGRGHNFLLTMLRLARERQSIRVVNDQVGAPTWARSLSNLTAGVVEQALQASARQRVEFSGTYHATAGGATTWYGFAQAIFDRARAVGLTEPPILEPISSDSYPSPVRRPRNSVLNNDRLRATFNLALPRWEHDLAACVNDIAAGSGAAAP
jgi:dTDP-4-dehydrorhamnose reductase